MLSNILYPSQRARTSRRRNEIYRNEPMDWPRRTTYYDQPRTITRETDTEMHGTQFQGDIYRLPDPEPGSKPPAAWDEWEKNKNWPFPADMSEDQIKKLKMTLKKSTSKTTAQKTALQEEYKRNANWPFPAPKKTSSQPVQDALRLRTLSGSRPMERRPSDARQSDSEFRAPPRAPVERERPFYLRQEPPVEPVPTTASALLAQDSIGLVFFDLRLPYTSVLKQVRGSHWTHLNYEDRKQSACTPPRTQMRIYTHITGSKWIANVRPRSLEYVTVEDVLMAIYSTFNVPLDPQQWARDSVDPTLADRVVRAYRRRIEKLERHRPHGYENARKAGLLRVDYLGSKYVFAGIRRCYGADGSEWWQMDVAAERK